MEKTLANGVTIAYLDESKKVAGDRWLVKLRCRVSAPLQGWMVEAVSGSDLQAAFCRQRLGAGLRHETVLERNFIDAGARERVLAEMIDGLEETLLGYLATEGFARQLYRKQLAEATEHFRRQAVPPVPQAEVDDPPGPADFSACFR